MGSEIVIAVSGLRAAVSRRVDLAHGWTYERAANWEALEDEAIDEVLDFGGLLAISGLYPCSPELAEKAIWQKRTESG